MSAWLSTIRKAPRRHPAWAVALGVVLWGLAYSQLEIEKVEDYAEIASFGVMATPGVVVDGLVVHTGSVPTVEMIEGWIRERSRGAAA